MGASTKVENSLPNVVWLEHILPCLDRPSWNALMEASKVLYTLATASRLTAEYNSLGPAIAQPPWPTNLSFQSKFGGQGQAIESLTISQDGEFMACGSVITGKGDSFDKSTSRMILFSTHPLDTSPDTCHLPVLGKINARARSLSSCPTLLSSS